MKNDSRLRLWAAQGVNCKNFLATAGLLYVAVIWGSTFIVVKDSLQFVDPVILVAYRFLLAALMMAGFLIYRRRPLWANLKSGLVLGALLWLVYGPQTIGLKTTTAANSGFITGLFVAFVPLLSLLFFKQWPTGQRLLTILMAVAGLWLLTGGLVALNQGDMLTIIAAVGFAAYILAADRYLRAQLDPLVLSFQQFLVVGGLSLAIGGLFELPFSITSAGGVGLVIFLTLFPSLSGFVIQMLAQKYVAPVRVALILTLEPVFAAAFAWTLGGEPFIVTRAAGGLLIFGAMILAEAPLPRLGILRYNRPFNRLEA